MYIIMIQYDSLSHRPFSPTPPCAPHHSSLSMCKCAPALITIIIMMIYHDHHDHHNIS